jgi:glycosyltransferase involved in cell wall biosynthesis
MGGGVERVMIRLSEELLIRGYDVDMVVMSSSGRMRDLIKDRVNVIVLGTGFIAPATRKFLRYMKSYRPNFIISAQSTANVVSVLSNIFSGGHAKVLVSEHSAMNLILSPAPTLKGKVKQILAKASYRRADAIVTVSDGLASLLRRELRAGAGRVHTVYNAAWSPDILRQGSEEINHPWFGPAQPPVVLAVGALNEAKDFGTLVDAIAIVRRNRDVRLVILGEGPLRSRLESQIQRLKLRDAISLLGYVTNPFAFMARASVYALSSVHEGLPTVLIEAMACGIPIVSTDCPSGGTSEILSGGRYGLLVPVGDPIAMARAILHMLDHPTSGESLKARAREFSTEKAANEYLRCLGVSQSNGSGRLQASTVE